MDRPATYEFSEAQNLVFKMLSDRMRLFGAAVVLAALLLLGAAALIYRSLDEPLSMVGLMALSAVYLLLLGGPKLGIARAFAQIQETSKNDVGYLMTALSGLERVFLINCVVVLLVIIGAFLVPQFTVPA